jgi:hypothetical protein
MTLHDRAQARMRREIDALVGIGRREKAALETGYYNGYVDGFRAARRSGKKGKRNLR